MHILLAYTRILLDINPYIQTRGHARANSPLRLSPPLSLSLSLSLSPSPSPSHAVSPSIHFGHRRSTIDASSLPASARIYGNVYAGRSYIRGF